MTKSEISHTTIITPVSAMTPSKRLILGSSNLSRLRVRLALKLRRRTTSDVRMQFLAFPAGIHSRLHGLLGRRSTLGRLVDLRPAGLDGCGSWVWCARLAEGAGGLGLQLLEAVLFVFGKTWGCGTRLPGTEWARGGECADRGEMREAGAQVAWDA